MSSGFYVFFTENYKITNASNMTMADKIWRQMPVDMKKKYNEKAMKQRGVKTLYNCLGIDVSLIEKRQILLENMEAEETNHIIEMVNDEHLENVEFLTLGTNCYCHIDDLYVTSEVSVVPFTLAGGLVCQPYHLIIDSKIPPGLAYEATQNVSLFGIPLPPVENSVPFNKMKILSELLTISKDRPFFVTPTKKRQVISFLDQLVESLDEKENPFKVYSVTKLLYYMHNKVAKQPRLVFLQMAENALEINSFSFACNISCWLHETTEVYAVCSLASCRRVVFTICSYCCDSLGIVKTEGLHYPEDRNKIFTSNASIDIINQQEPMLPQYAEDIKNKKGKGGYQTSVATAQVNMVQERWPELNTAANTGAIPKTNFSWGQRLCVASSSDVTQKSDSSDNEMNLDSVKQSLQSYISSDYPPLPSGSECFSKSSKGSRKGRKGKGRKC